MLRISTEKVDILEVKTLTLERESNEADHFEAIIPNVNDRYTFDIKSIEDEPLRFYWDEKLMFTGILDQVTYTIDNEGERVRLEGRGPLAKLQDDTVENVLNEVCGKSAGEIARKMAESVGLKIGRIEVEDIVKDYSGLTPESTKYELLEFLQSKTGAIFWIDREGKFNFLKPKKQEPKIEFVYPDKLPKRIEIYESKTLTLSFKVKVIGYDPRRKRKIVCVAESPQRNRPNYKLITIRDYSLHTKEEVCRRAKGLLRLYSLGFVVLEGEIPGFMEADVGDVLQLKGMDMPERYIITKLAFDLSTDDGLVTRFRAEVLDVERK